MRPNNARLLAENWFKPRLEEHRAAFRGAVQGKLAEFAARNNAISPQAYAAVENLACREVERCGEIFLAGYEKAFSAISDPISPALVRQVKHDLDILLSIESNRVLTANPACSRRVQAGCYEERK